jgi:exopolysaccharide biosynthesis protein
MWTQETQLQDNQRHPRLLLGTTRQGKNLIAAISGRTRISCGATHTESVLYCQQLVPPHDELLNLINLDGGASVFLEAREPGKSIILNFPAPSDLNPAGVLRPNSAVLTIAPKENKEIDH